MLNAHLDKTVILKLNEYDYVKRSENVKYSFWTTDQRSTVQKEYFIRRERER